MLSVPSFFFVMRILHLSKELNFFKENQKMKKKLFILGQYLDG